MCSHSVIALSDNAAMQVWFLEPSPVILSNRVPSRSNLVIQSHWRYFTDLTETLNHIQIGFRVRGQMETCPGKNIGIKGLTADYTNPAGRQVLVERTCRVLSQHQYSFEFCRGCSYMTRSELDNICSGEDSSIASSVPIESQRTGGQGQHRNNADTHDGVRRATTSSFKVNGVGGP